MCCTIVARSGGEEGARSRQSKIDATDVAGVCQRWLLGSVTRTFEGKFAPVLHLSSGELLKQIQQLTTLFYPPEEAGCSCQLQLTQAWWDSRAMLM